MISVEELRKNDVWLIRFGQAHFKIGDPYTHSCTAAMNDRGEVEFRGLGGPIGIDHYKWIRNFFVSQGLCKFFWERKKKGIIRQIKIQTNEGLLKENTMQSLLSAIAAFFLAIGSNVDIVALYNKDIEDAKAQQKADDLAAAGAPPISQEDIDAAVKAAVDPLNAQIVDLQGQVSALQTSQSDFDVKVASAVASLKADLLVKYQTLEVVEAAFEAELK